MTKQKVKYVTSETFDHTADYCFEHPKGESLTVSGESYTIRELMERHNAGMRNDSERETYYQDTQDFDAIDFSRIKYADPYEKAQMLEDVKAKADRAYKALEAWKKDQASQDNGSGDDDKKPEPKKQKADQGEPGEQGSKRSGATDASSGEPKGQS